MYQGLLIFNKNNTNGNLLTNKISQIYKDGKGDLWMGSFFDPIGLMRFTPTKKYLSLGPIDYFKNNPENSNSLTFNKIASIYEDSNEVLWVGTKKGLNKITRDQNNIPSQISQIFHDKNDTNSLSNNNVFAIHEDSEEQSLGGNFLVVDLIKLFEIHYMQTPQNSYILIRRKVYQIM